MACEYTRRVKRRIGVPAAGPLRSWDRGRARRGSSERVPQFVRRDDERQRVLAALGEQLVRPLFHRLQRPLADVVLVAARARGVRERGSSRPPCAPRARRGAPAAGRSTSCRRRSCSGRRRAAPARDPSRGRAGRPPAHARTGEDQACHERMPARRPRLASASSSRAASSTATSCSTPSRCTGRGRSAFSRRRLPPRRVRRRVPVTARDPPPQ
jgi:hypothetical protein